MAVSNTDKRSPASGGYACNGSTTAFAGTFRITAAADVKVILTDAAGTESTLTLTTDYTISPTGGSYPADAFTVTTTSTYASGNTITLIRALDATQPTSYGNAGPYLPANHETSFDRLTLLIQQLQEEIDRCVKDDASGTASTDPDSYLAACQAAQAAAEAAAAGLTNSNLFAVRCKTQANVDLTADLEAGKKIDNVTLVAGDLVLVADQSTTGDDGIYVAPASGTASRATNYPTGLEFAGHVYSVDAGTVSGSRTYYTVSAGSGVVGTDDIAVEEILSSKNLSDDEHLVKRSGVMTEESLTSFAATILDDADAGTARTTLGLGTMSTQAASSVAITGGTMDGVTVTNSGALSSDGVLHVRDEKATTTAGGTFTSGAWQTRDLNTVKANTITSAYLLYELPYDNKSGTFQVGETVTGGTSSATAVVWSLSGGSSPLIVYNISGTFQDDEQITGGTSSATADVNNLTPEDSGTGLNYYNQVLLPSGTYRFKASANTYLSGDNQLRLYDNTGTATLFVGQNAHDNDSNTSSIASMRGQFTLGATSAIELEHYSSAGNATNGFGKPNSFGENEVYADLEIYKVG